MEVYSNQNVKITYNPTTKRLTQVWQGFASTQNFRTAIDVSEKFCLNNEVVTALSDTRAQQVVGQDDSEYASKSLHLMFREGLKRFAFLLPRDLFNQLAVADFLKQFPDGQAKLFLPEQEREAETWLREIE